MRFNGFKAIALEPESHLSSMKPDFFCISTRLNSLSLHSHKNQRFPGSHLTGIPIHDGSWLDIIGDSRFGRSEQIPTGRVSPGWRRLSDC
jgi:hypothetical protein